MPLDTYFDRIAVISLPKDRDRRMRLQSHLRDLKIDARIKWIEATNGCDHILPKGWTAGHGGYGCLLSHKAVLESAVRDGVRRLLVLEDDVVFSWHLHEWLPRFMEALPGDWDQLYLGGQHVCRPEETGHPLVLRPRDVNRTHAYAVQHHALRLVLSHITEMRDYLKLRGWHVDWQFGRAHARLKWRTWSPPWWLAGQSECVSNVASGRVLQERWWHPFFWGTFLPVISLPDTVESVPVSERPRLLLPSHPGLSDDVRNAFRQRRGHDALILPWLRLFARLALNCWQLPAIPAADIEPRRLARLWPAGVIPYEGQDLTRLCDYPFNGLFPHPMNTVRLKAGSTKTYTHTSLSP